MSEDDHDLLMARLRAIADEVDRQPEILNEMARAAFSTRRLEGELAELVMDSASVTPALVRDADDSIRLLLLETASLETASVSVELQLEMDNEAITIRGMVSGASGEMAVETTADNRRIELDEQGLFTITGLPPDAFRLRLTGEDGTPVTTSWISV